MTKYFIALLFTGIFTATAFAQTGQTCASDSDCQAGYTCIKTACPGEGPCGDNHVCYPKDGGAAATTPPADGRPACNTPECAKMCSDDQASPRCGAGNTCVCAKY